MYYNKHLQQIHEKFIKVIERNFDTEFVADVKIRSGSNFGSDGTGTDNADGMFIVQDIKNKNIINCYSDLNTNHLHKGDQIRIRGTIKPSLVRLGSCYVFVTFFCAITDELRLEESIQLYYKTKRKILSLNPHDQMHSIQSKQFPQVIQNVGLIVFYNNKSILNMFIEQFRQTCTGKLIIYTVTEKQTILDALNYFDLSIDVICIVNGKLSLDQILAMSGSNIINEVYRYVKKSTYVISVSHTISNRTILGSNVTDYLCYHMTNKQLTSIQSCINLISQSQLTYANTVNNSVRIGLSKMNEIVNSYTNNLLFLESYVDLIMLGSKSGVRAGLIPNSVEQLKTSICEKLDREKDRLINIELIILSQMIHFYNTLEKKIEKKNPDIKENNPLIDTTIINNGNH